MNWLQQRAPRSRGAVGELKGSMGVYPRRVWSLRIFPLKSHVLLQMFVLQKDVHACNKTPLWRRTPFVTQHRDPVGPTCTPVGGQGEISHDASNGSEGTGRSRSMIKEGNLILEESVGQYSQGACAFVEISKKQ